MLPLILPPSGCRCKTVGAHTRLGPPGCEQHMSTVKPSAGAGAGGRWRRPRGPRFWRTTASMSAASSSADEFEHSFEFEQLAASKLAASSSAKSVYLQADNNSWRYSWRHKRRRLHCPLIRFINYSFSATASSPTRPRPRLRLRRSQTCLRPNLSAGSDENRTE